MTMTEVDTRRCGPGDDFHSTLRMDGQRGQNTATKRGTWLDRLPRIFPTTKSQKSRKKNNTPVLTVEGSRNIQPNLRDSEIRKNKK